MNEFRIKLTNGMTVLLRPDESAPVVSIQLWVKTGSFHETDDLAGISHFVEHMLFKGTKNMNLAELSRIIEGSGGEINAYTSFEQTTVHVVLAGRYWEKGLNVVSDLVLNPIFPADGLETERKVILEEIKEGEDSPEVILSQKLFKESYRNLNYARPVIGYSKTVSSMTRSDLFGFLKAHYVPNNMVLSIAGSFNPSEAVEKIKKLFEERPYSPIKKVFRLEDEPKSGFNYSFVKKGDSDTIIDYSFPIPGANHPDMPAIDMLSTILGDGESSRLYQALVAPGKTAREAASYSFAPAGPGLFLVRVTPFKDNFKTCFQKALEVLWKLKEENVLTEEIERARSSIEKDLIFQEETVYGKARKLAYYETLFEDHTFEKKYLRAIESIDQAEIKRVAQKYLNHHYLTSVVLFPENSEVCSREESLSLLESSLKDKKSLEVASAVKKIKRFKSTVREAETENKVRIITKENKSSHLVSITTIAPGGVRSETEENNGISNLLSTLMQRGTKRRSFLDIANEITMLGGYAETFVGKNSFGFKMDVLEKSFERALDLYFDMMCNSSIPEEYLKMEKKKTVEEIKALRDNFDSYGYYEFLKLMYGDHPYGLNSMGTVESMKKIDRRLILDKYEHTLDPSNLIVSVSGYFSKKSLDKIRSYLSSLKTKRKNNFVDIKLVNIHKPLEKNKKIKSKNAYIHMGFRGTNIRSKDKYPIEIINAALSNLGEGKLFVHLREKLGLAYSVYSTVFHGLEDGYFVIYMSTDPRNVDKSIKEVKNVIADLTEKGLKEEELERIKKFLIGSYEIELQRNSTQAVSLALNKLYGLPLDLQTYSKEIMKVTNKSVSEALKKYLDLNRYVLNVLSP